MSVLTILSDGQWHNTKDLKVETHVSPRTLYNNLKKLKNFIEREEDKRTYPHRVFYRATPTLLSLMLESVSIEGITKALMKDLLDTKDLASILKFFNELINAKILSTLSVIKKCNVTDSKVVLFLLRSFVLECDEILIAGIVKASMKIINDIDLEQVKKNLRKE